MPDFEQRLLKGEVPNIQLIRDGLINWLRHASITQSMNRTAQMFVGVNTYNARVRALRGLIDEALDLAIADANKSLEQISKIKMQREALDNIFESNLFAPQDADEREALSKVELELLLDASRPVSRLNPWRGYIPKIRNYPMTLLLFRQGIRRGELAGMMKDDVLEIEGQHYIRVFRRPDDDRDPRKRQPAAKTQPRVLPISIETWTVLQHYIRKVRPMTKAALEHDYLFVSSRTGAPLSLSGVNIAIAQLGFVLGRRIFPHIGRHTVASDYLADAREDGKTEKEARGGLMSLCGWKSEGSVERYTKRERDRTRDEVLKKHQRKVFDE
ncbi:tyrosine-type recombinase/integrase [Paraburkholderia unamae]|nr:site-specific integrase [Paraburkholderia unamae]